MKIPSVTNQMHRVAPRGKSQKPIFYDSPELADARQKFVAHLSGQKPDEPMKGPVALRTVWCYPAEGKHYDGEYKTTKPDTDNLVKLFKDCMTKVGFWKDDAQVAYEVIEKRYCDHPGIYVEAWEIVKENDQ